MDEVDSIGSARSDSGGGSGGGDSEVQRTMLELLNQLDGFEATNKIKVCDRHPSCNICNGCRVCQTCSMLGRHVLHIQMPSGVSLVC